ncbi:protein SMG9 [Scaptodrosophila lebanonensis]|uniref:Protein SMG9 n=1 Tax=Drosophila lebanonensis TaxID=7225 RepID=A0A6J2TRA4_DROLE|nr:protein SMG9 [Scaptodrosophila lebanonensis]
MADRRRRFRNNNNKKNAEEAQPTPVTIARREDSRANVQPKILLKKEQDVGNSGSTSTSSSSNNQELPYAAKTIIAGRTDSRSSCERSQSTSVQSGSGVCGSTTATSSSKDRTDGVAASTTPVETVPRMTRPMPIVVSSGIFNANARKMFHKTNTDFTVVGVLGAQCVGKSSLLNLLTTERASDYDYYEHLFGPNADACIFPTRHKCKSTKNVLRPRTETTQFFITKERMVLIDTAPFLGSVGAKEAEYLDTQSVATMAQLISLCHVLVIAFDEISMEQVRLVYAAVRLRPRAIGKNYLKNFLPHVIFVRTHAQRQDFEPVQRERLENQLHRLYGNTGLPIYRGRGDVKRVNSFYMPEVHNNEATTYHASLSDIVRKFRERVFSATRQHMCLSNDFSEAAWFDLIGESMRLGQHFEKIYAELKSRHFDGKHQNKWRLDCWRSYGGGDSQIAAGIWENQCK